MNQKNLFILSLGCPKNLVDSEVMLGILTKNGYRVCQDAEEADLLLVNTCGFIQSAVEEAIDEILELAKVKKQDPNKILAVTGCLVQRYGKDLAKELPEVDLFIGTEGFPKILDFLKDLDSEKEARISPLPYPSFVMNATVPRQISTPPHRAYLKITEGCSNRCTYCMIPSIRGDLRSRQENDILSELALMEKGGVKELTLIAQDLTSYGRDLGQSSPNLVSLLEKMLTSSQIPWLRLLYLYPVRITEPLLDLMAASPRITPYLDIPFQHVSDRILSLMNRPYTLKDIEVLISKIRDKLPGAAIRTTLMTGFPGESQEDVELMAQFLKTHELEHVGVFAYSNEDGCGAAQLPGHMDDEEKNARMEQLMEIQAEIAARKNRAMIGKTEKVLVEGVSRETELLLEGRTRFQAPDIDGCVYINEGECNPGDLVDVRFTEAHIYDLVGEIVS